MTSEKLEGTTTIEVSVETAKQLHSLKDKLAKILRKRNVSFDQLFRLFCEIKPINTILEDMLIEEGVEHQWKKKKS
jgi:uncharacterized protein YajQ (UPF0234 family)